MKVSKPFYCFLCKPDVGTLPFHLLAMMQVRQKFESAGGLVMEKTPAEGVQIHPNGVALQLQEAEQSVTGQLLIDCMGNFSPIVRQVSPLCAHLSVMLMSLCH